MKKRKKGPDPGTTTRRIARKLVGTVPSTKVIVPKTLRKPKHKKDSEEPQD